MSCQISINCTKPKEELVEKLKQAVLSQNGTFTGDTTSGSFKAKTPLGTFEASYTINQDLITIHVTEKPFLISCKRIEKEINDYLNAHAVINESFQFEEYSETMQFAAPVYSLMVSKIDLRKTPQSGDYRAGASIKQEAESDNKDSWHGGENKYDGNSASIPVNFFLGGLGSAEVVSLFIGLDDDAEDAGNESKSEDQLHLKFKVFPTGGKEKLYDHQEGDWSIVVHYTLTN